MAFTEIQIVNGKKINVTILHPPNGQDMEVELNDGLSVEDVMALYDQYKAVGGNSFITEEVQSYIKRKGVK